MKETAERVSYSSAADNYVFNRQFRAYEVTKDRLSGKVLEVGSGDGYGLKLVAPMAKEYTALDKFVIDIDKSSLPNVTFIQAVIPPLSDFEDDTFDHVICFQVIEHIEDDHLLIKEIKRVLKPGGKLYMTTPNIKMTLSRNPWHIREYTTSDFTALLRSAFDKVDVQGVFGDKVVMEYYEENKASVRKIMKYDIFNLQYRLPRWMLQIPFDILNKRNRSKLLEGNPSLSQKISTDNFSVEAVSDTCLDFYGIAEA